MRTVITARALCTPLKVIESPVLVIEDGRIQAVTSRLGTELPADSRHFDFPQMIAAPGLMDVHIHGNAGYDVMNADRSGLAALQRAMARHGVTSYLPTTVTASEDHILRALENLAQAIAAKGYQEGACPLGIHLEGPFISHARRGVHPPENLITPSARLLDRFWQASHGTMRVITIAPELPGAIETIELAGKLGVHCSLGHSNATSQEAEHGIAAGADHATHTFNAMRALDHREPGILGTVLSDNRITADIIADGVHVDPRMVKLFLVAKGLERAILITDAMSATGMGDGVFKLGSLEVEVKGDRCEVKGTLAGSVLTLDRAVRNVMRFAGWKLQQALRLATYNPARLLGITKRKGSIVPGADADLVILTPEGEVVQTFVGGQAVQA